MKKRITIFAIVFVLGIVACFIFIFGNSNGEFESVTPDEIIASLNKNENIFVYYGLENCAACKSATSVIFEASEKLKVPIKYLNGDKYDCASFSDTYNIQSAPSLLYTKDGQIVVYDGDFHIDEVENFITHISQDSTIDRVKNIQPISFEELYSKRDNSFDFILYIGRDDCRDCKKFHPIVESCMGTDYGLYYFDIKQYRLMSLSEKSTEAEKLIYDNLKKDFDITWVPSVYHIINGNIVSKYEFLDSKYYEIEEKIEQDEYLEGYVRDFNDWMQTNY